MSGMVWTLVRSMVVLVITYSCVASAFFNPAIVCLKAPLRPHHLIVDLLIARFDRDLDMVEPGIHQLLDISLVHQPAGIGVQPGDLSVRFGMPDQLGQVIAQGRFAAGEDDVRNAQLPELVEDPDPLFCGQLGEVPLAGIVAVGAVVVAAIGDRQVHAVGSGRPGAERHDRFQIQLVDRAGAIGTHQFAELEAEIGQITARL